MKPEYLFVYGTLRKNIQSKMSEVMSRYCTFYNVGFLKGKLFNITEYPGVILSDNPKDRVIGELFKLSEYDLALELLDDYEECSPKFSEPHEYIRTIQNIYLTNGEVINAWVYIYNLDTNNLFLIESGDYLEFLKSKSLTP